MLCVCQKSTENAAFCLSAKARKKKAIKKSRLANNSAKV